MATLEVVTLDKGGAMHVRLLGELDLGSAGELEAALRNAEAQPSERTVVDLSGLDFIDSTGLSTLVAADQRLRAAGRRLSLVPGPPPVQRVFEITGLDRHFDVLDAAAVEADGPGRARP
jgi:anti-sigma B factor antagonist